MNLAPVFIVDDDQDEREIIEEIWNEMNEENQIIFFPTAQSVLDHLKKDPTNPFIIICDVNLPKMDGYELLQQFSTERTLRYKNIPFVFWSTAASNEQIKKAYDQGAHGFFVKGLNYQSIRESLEVIIGYWKMAKAPVISN